MPTDVQYSIIKKIAMDKKGKQIVSWDPQEYYLKETEFNIMAYEMLSMVDLFLPSREEIVAMCGKGDLAATIKKLASKGPKAIAVKMSTDGTLVYNQKDGKIYHVPIYPSATVDPTGAGDSFCGGFLSAFVNSGDAIDSACHGTVAASYVVESIGALNTMRCDFSDIGKRLEMVRKNVCAL
jgi:sugar/nucleoside kinase (ribokinase family)